MIYVLPAPQLKKKENKMEKIQVVLNHRYLKENPRDFITKLAVIFTSKMLPEPDPKNLLVKDKKTLDNSIL